MEFKGRRSYIFCISKIDDHGWLWGDDIPSDAKYTSDGNINYHSKNFCKNLSEKRRKIFEEMLGGG